MRLQRMVHPDKEALKPFSISEKEKFRHVPSLAFDIFFQNITL